MEILLTAPLKRIKKIETFGEAEPLENRRTIFHTAIFLGRPSSPLKRLSEHWRNGIRNWKCQHGYGVRRLQVSFTPGTEWRRKIRILGSSVDSNAADRRYRDEVLVFHALENAWASTWLFLAALNLEFYGRPLLLIR